MVFHEIIQDAAGTAGQVAGSAWATGEDTLQEAEEEQREQEQAEQDVAMGFATGNLGQAFAGASEFAEDAKAQEQADQDSGGGNAIDWAWGGLTDVGSGTADIATDAGSAALDVPADAVNTWTSPYGEAAPESTGWIGAGSDAAVGGVAKESGLRAWQETETFQQLSEQVASGGILDRIDAGAKGLVDFSLDNPRFSIQDTTRGGVTGAFSLATGEDWSGEDVAGAISSTGSNIQGGIGDTLAGTPLDNPGTDVLTWAGEAVAVEPGKALLGGTTGLNPDTGGTEATVGAVDLLEIGSGAATFGSGTLLARGAAGGADEGGRLLSRFLGGSDDAATAADDVATPALPAPDEAVQAGDDTTGLGGLFGDDAATGADDVANANTRVFTQADEAARTSGESATAFRETVLEGSDDAAQASDDLPVLADDAGQASDDVAGAADDAGEGFLTGTLASGFATVGRMGEDFLGLGARGADDAVTAADDVAGAADDSGGLFDGLLGRGSDDAATASDDTVTAADDTGSLVDDTAQAGEDAADEAGRFRRFLGTRTGKVTAASGALVGGGAVYSEVFTNPRNAPDEIETADGSVLSARKTYQPTNRFPNGGRLYEVRRSGSRAGYWTLLGRQGRNLIVLDSSGDTRQAKISIDQFQELVQGGQGGNQ